MNLEDHIEEGHVGSTCPLCDTPVGSEEKHRVVVAHDHKFIIHSDCLEDLKERE
jgi:hypothetical protein